MITVNLVCPLPSIESDSNDFRPNYLLEVGGMGSCYRKEPWERSPRNTAPSVSHTCSRPEEGTEHGGAWWLTDYGGD